MEERLRAGSTAFRVYASLLRLYPKQYQKEYREQILHTAADMLEDARTAHERRAVWAKLAVDLPINICREHYHVLGDYMNTNDERQFRHRVHVSSVLMSVPLFLIVVTHLLAEVGLVHRNYGALVVLISALVPVVALLVASSALQQMTHAILIKLPKRQRRHVRVLIGLVMFAIVVVMLSAINLFITNH